MCGVFRARFFDLANTRYNQNFNFSRMGRNSQRIMSMILFSLVNNIPFWGTVIFAVLFVSAAVGKYRNAGLPSTASRAVGRFIVGIGLSVMLIAGTNYVINPFGAYPTHVVEPLGTVSRSLKLQLFDELPHTPDLVILGSSRSMNVSPDDIQRQSGLSAFNAGVNAAIPRDFLALLLYMEQQNRLPKVLVVGLGLEQLSEDDYGPRIENPDPLDRYVAWDAPPAPSLLSIEQTQATFRLLATLLAGQYVSDRLQANRKLFSANGWHSLSGGSVDPEVADNLAADAVRTAPSFAHGVNDSQFDHLKSLVELCQKHHIRLVIYFPPYHPSLLAYYEQSTPYLQVKQNIMSRLNALQATYPFTWYDFTDVKSFQGDSSDMVDAFHPSNRASQKIIMIILKDLETSLNAF
jgi:hypothetical protein